MLKFVFTTAVVAIGMIAIPSASQAQQPGSFLRGQNAEIGGALTDAQARRACRRALSGSRDSKRSLAIKMRNCVIEKQVGGR